VDISRRMERGFLSSSKNGDGGDYVHFLLEMMILGYSMIFFSFSSFSSLFLCSSLEFFFVLEFF